MNIKEAWAEARWAYKLSFQGYLSLAASAAIMGRPDVAGICLVVSLLMSILISEQVRADRQERIAQELARQVRTACQAGLQWQRLSEHKDRVHEGIEELVGVANLIVHGHGPRADR